MTSQSIDPVQFVASVRPLLAAQDVQRLCCHLRERWGSDQIARLLLCSDRDTRNVAALALAMVGNESCIPLLAERLKDSDPSTNEIAEHALWSIWFRGGSDQANHELARGALAINRKDLGHAIDHFDRAIELCPAFAEAYNQRAIAYYLLEEYEESLRDCQKAVCLMDCHFGAWGGLGHCQAHLGDLDGAITSYERALAINPRLPCIAEGLCELKARRRCR